MKQLFALTLIGLASAAFADEKSDKALVNYNDHIKGLCRIYFRDLVLV